jgi:hypothetical protein
MGFSRQVMHGWRIMKSPLTELSVFGTRVREVARELLVQEEINAQSYYLANGGENDEPGAFVLDPKYPVLRPPCPEMSPDDPVYEETLVKPPMQG